MLNPRSFSDILIDSIEQKLSEDTSSSLYNSGWESTLDAYGMAQIMAQTQTHSFHRFDTQKLYKRPVRPSHNLSPEQSQAFEILKKYTAVLRPNFTARELKTAYRLSVLKAHPDQGGTSETFQEVKKSYQILQALAKNEA